MKLSVGDEIKHMSVGYAHELETFKQELRLKNDEIARLTLES